MGCQIIQGNHIERGLYVITTISMDLTYIPCKEKGKGSIVATQGSIPGRVKTYWHFEIWGGDQTEHDAFFLEPRKDPGEYLGAKGFQLE